MNKWERKQARKDARKSLHDEQRRERAKSLKDKPKTKRPKWRRLNDGGIAFGDNYKIGRGGQIGLGVVGAVALFFIVGLTLYTVEQQDGGECANPFCEWVDIITGADEYGAKQTPKEQVPESERDFLPPTEFLLPFAEARGDDEPTCYSQACQRSHEESKDIFDSEEAQAKSINEQIVDMKVKIEKTKEVIKVIEGKRRDLKLEIRKTEIDLR